MKPIPIIRSRSLAALLALGLALAAFTHVAQAQTAAPPVKAMGKANFFSLADAARHLGRGAGSPLAAAVPGA